jgi:hypothetical protein
MAVFVDGQPSMFRAEHSQQLRFVTVAVAPAKLPFVDGQAPMFRAEHS